MALPDLTQPAEGSDIKLTVVTPTRDRPVTLRLCVQFMARQTRPFDQWIIVDDGFHEIPANWFQDLSNLTLLRRPRRHNDPASTLNLNLELALTHVTGTHLVFVEDDDWYARDYLEWVEQTLEKTRADLIGQQHPINYDFLEKRLIYFNTCVHSSLASSVVSMNVVETLRECLKLPSRTTNGFVNYLDLELWRRVKNNYLEHHTKVVGIKNLPGVVNTCRPDEFQAVTEVEVDEIAVDLLDQRMLASIVARVPGTPGTDFVFAKDPNGGLLSQLVEEDDVSTYRALTASSPRKQTIRFFTICNNEYLDRAPVLAESFKRFNHYPLDVVLCDERGPQRLAFVDQVVKYRDVALPIPGSMTHDRWLLLHNVTELATAIKASVFKHYLTRCDKAVYLDPDFYILGSLDVVSRILDECSIAVTPHRAVPETSDLSIQLQETIFLKRGVFNFGFLALRDTTETWKFLDWWEYRLMRWCYASESDGLFVDQLWGNFIPVYCRDYRVLNPNETGINVSTWSISSFKSIVKNDGALFLDGQPLLAYHFSSGPSVQKEVLFTHYGYIKGIELICDLCDEYRDAVNKKGRLNQGSSLVHRDSLSEEQERQIFDWRRYVMKYGDLQKLGLVTSELAWQHWKKFGKREGRSWWC